MESVVDLNQFRLFLNLNAFYRVQLDDGSLTMSSGTICRFVGKLRSGLGSTTYRAEGRTWEEVLKQLPDWAKKSVRLSNGGEV